MYISLFFLVSISFALGTVFQWNMGLDLGLGFEFQDLFLGLGGFWFTLRSS